MALTMHAKDTVSGVSAECFVTVDGKRYNFMQAVNVEAKMEKTKKEVAILGKTSKGHKSAGWNGTGKASFYYNTSIFRELLYKYKTEGKDIYFDMQIVNEDPTSDAGRQTIILRDCNINGGMLAIFDAEGDTLKEDVEFTFEDWEMPEKFNILSGME